MLFLLTILARVVCVAILATFAIAVGLVITSTVRECASCVAHHHSHGRRHPRHALNTRADAALRHHQDGNS